MKKINQLIALGVILMGVGTIANAGTATGTVLHPSVTMAASCTVDTAGVSVGFGTFGLDRADKTDVSAGNIIVNCGSGVAYKLGLGAGSNFASGTRNLKDALGTPGTDVIPYALKLATVAAGDGGLAAIDGTYNETMGTVQAYSSTGTGADQSIALSADINFATATVAGLYEDTVVVTVAW